ncbi:hypothetical protein [Moorella sp. E306M]|uniref:hypothetical protein n=1 Tax=Moorella sp. E306M TaxID=2572683 RepID=UPI0010FFB366|nr:hypothetical protein [Moorella sp. E306M]GEA17719.1 hypothetical protein E306M_08530 [Moorella sp. E306M]
MPSNKRKVIRVFCDESRQTKARYMVLAGIWIPQKYIPEYEDHHKKTIEVTFKVSVDSDGGGGPFQVVCRNDLLSAKELSTWNSSLIV